MAAGLAILLAAAATALALGPSPRSMRLRRIAAEMGPANADPAADDRAPTPGGLASARARAASALVMGVAAGWWIGGFPGPVVGLCVASAAWFGLRYVESKADVRPRATNSPAVPLVAELMSAAVAAGCPPVVAAEAVADALGGPVGAVLRSTAAAVRLGSDPGTAWLGLGATDPAFRPLARALASSATWGTSPNEMLDRAARDARDTARWAAEARARSLGARAAAPLGLCFLPAFVLVGIVPLVVTAAAPLLP